MSKKTTLELLEDNLNKHIEVCDLKRKVKKLQAENERLRKAGDAMAYELHSCEPDRQIALIEDWFAIKEGRDAK